MLFEKGDGFRLKAGMTVQWLDSFLCWNEWGTNRAWAEILLVGWGAADGRLLATGEGPLRGGLWC